MKEWHHYYLGLIMLGFSFYALFYLNKIVGLILFSLGVIVIIDDFFQHYTERISILHRLYIRILYKYDCIRKLNDWLDKLFGKRK